LTNEQFNSFSEGGVGGKEGSGGWGNGFPSLFISGKIYIRLGGNIHLYRLSALLATFRETYSTLNLI
jgi:hypothetical protein